MNDSAAFGSLDWLMTVPAEMGKEIAAAISSIATLRMCFNGSFIFD